MVEGVIRGHTSAGTNFICHCCEDSEHSSRKSVTLLYQIIGHRCLAFSRFLCSRVLEQAKFWL